MADQAKTELLEAIASARKKIAPGNGDKKNSEILAKVMELNGWLVDNPKSSKEKYDSKKRELEKILEVFEAMAPKRRSPKEFETASTPYFEKSTNLPPTP